MSLEEVGLVRVRQAFELRNIFRHLSIRYPNRQIGPYSNACRDCPFAGPGGGCIVANPYLLRHYHHSCFVEGEQDADEEAGIRIQHDCDGRVFRVDTYLSLGLGNGYDAIVTLRRAMTHRATVVISCFYPGRHIKDAYAVYAPLQNN